MDCRETQALLNAFHDGELPTADRARVEEHLRGCKDCGALLAGLARADRAAGVPDPGPAYWDRFNARLMDRVEREADGPGVRVLRPKGGWMREQLRYLVPAAAAAALVLVIVHYGGMRPGAPTPAAPQAVSKPEAPDSAGDRMAKSETGSGVTEKTGAAAVARRPPPPVLTEERSTAVTREEADRLADRSPPEGNGEATRERAAAAPAVAAPSPAPMMPYRSVPAGSPPVTTSDGMRREMQAERKAMEGASAGASPAVSLAAAQRSDSPCDLARTLAERERIRDAETAQRACLGGDLDAPTREKGLVFLAELLDRQARFAEADAVIAEVETQYPHSRPLELYRRQRPMVQKEPKAVPVSR